MNKLYSKPELEIEKFDVADIITESQVTVPTEGDITDLSAGMEFDINASGFDEF